MAMKGRKMNQKVLHIGIISYEDYKKRTLAISGGNIARNRMSPRFGLNPCNPWRRSSAMKTSYC